jgi:hypothetical protein
MYVPNQLSLSLSLSRSESLSTSISISISYLAVRLALDQIAFVDRGLRVKRRPWSRNLRVQLAQEAFGRLGLPSAHSSHRGSQGARACPPAMNGAKGSKDQPRTSPLRHNELGPVGPTGGEYSLPRYPRRIYPMAVESQRLRFWGPRGRTEGASADIYITHLFGPGTPLLVPGFQWSGWSNSVIHGQIRVRDGQIRASQTIPLGSEQMRNIYVRSLTKNLF